MNPRKIELDRNKIKALVGDPDTQGFVLFVIALQEFGDAVMGNPDEGIEQMDPSIMWAEFNSRFGGWVSEEGENRLNAIITGLQDGRFWRDLDTFLAVSTALFDGDLGDIIDVGFEDLSAIEIMWAILEMRLVWDSDDTPPFSIQIQDYVNGVLLKEQEDLSENVSQVSMAYTAMLDQLLDIGVPTSIIRILDEDYSAVIENLEDGQLDNA